MKNGKIAFGILAVVILVIGIFALYRQSLTASPGACSLENCHGLDIKCGPNPPDVCTEIYGVGDNCLHYAKCGIQDGKCQQIENPQFTLCKSCAQKCIDANMDDNVKLFECESNCR